jgi:hypothetical protein
MSYYKSLNEIELKSNIEIDDLKLHDFSTSDSNISVYFKNLDTAIIEKIKLADMIVGCVAWLTNLKILNELEKKQYLSIIIQKEDFLRPEDEIDWKGNLRKIYDRIINNSKLSKNDDLNFGSLRFSNMSYCGDDTIDSIRCVGYGGNSIVKPKMHHKFLVFSKKENEKFIPYAIWTGSFNFTHTGNKSFENGLYITSEKIANSYFREWGQILALSEKLNWDHEYCEPEWKYGS